MMNDKNSPDKWTYGTNRTRYSTVLNQLGTSGMFCKEAMMLLSYPILSHEVVEHLIFNNRLDDLTTNTSQ
jgi:hypothetical protein